MYLLASDSSVIIRWPSNLSIERLLGYFTPTDWLTIWPTNGLTDKKTQRGLYSQSGDWMSAILFPYLICGPKGEIQLLRCILTSQYEGLSVRWSVSPFVGLSVNLSDGPSTCQFVGLSVHQSIPIWFLGATKHLYKRVCPSICQSVNTSVRYTFSFTLCFGALEAMYLALFSQIRKINFFSDRLIRSQAAHPLIHTHTCTHTHTNTRPKLTH